MANGRRGSYWGKTGRDGVSQARQLMTHSDRLPLSVDALREQPFQPFIRQRIGSDNKPSVFEYVKIAA